MQQAIHTVQGPIQARVTLPGSKNLTLCALLIAALANGTSELSDILVSDDTRALIEALAQLGIAIQLDEDAHTCIVAGADGVFPKAQASVWCADAKIVFQFLLAACAATSGVFYFDGTTRLREQSIHPLLDLLRQQGAQFIPNDIQKMPFTLIGSDKLQGGDILLDGSATIEIITALLIIAPYARSEFNFTLTDLINQPYIDMTCGLMADFGVKVNRIHQGQFSIPVPQRYQARDYVIEPDLAIAAYFFAAAAITGGAVTIQPVRRKQSKQTDVKFLHLLEQMGCQIIEAHQGLMIKGPRQLRGIDVDMSEYSDSLLTLIAIAPFAQSPVRITYHGHLQPNEIERLNTAKQLLMGMGISIESGHDWIRILPGIPKGKLIDCQHDFRLAMAFSLIGLRIPGVIIDQAECVTKACPPFYALWDSMMSGFNVSI